MMLLMLLTLQAEAVVIHTSEPRPALPWQETFSARCGRQSLDISRPMRPLDRRPQILLNGRAPRGDLQPLQVELSQGRAAYRLSFLCAPDEGLQLRWVSGEADVQGQVRYRAGSATFRDGALIQVQAEDANEETFWYR